MGSLKKSTYKPSKFLSNTPSKNYPVKANFGLKKEKNTTNFTLYLQ